MVMASRYSSCVMGSLSMRSTWTVAPQWGAVRGNAMMSPSCSPVFSASWASSVSRWWSGPGGADRRSRRGGREIMRLGPFQEWVCDSPLKSENNTVIRHQTLYFFPAARPGVVIVLICMGVW